MPPSPPPAAAAEAQAASLDCLPDGLLGHIMGLVGRERGRSLTLVSRRWHRLFYSEPSLWRLIKARTRDYSTPAEARLCLMEQALLLHRVAPHVQHFVWSRYAEDAFTEAGLTCCLLALQPSRLLDLELRGALSLQGPAIAFLQQLASVTSLQVQFCRQGASTAVAAVGPHLRSLELSDHQVSPAALETSVQLTQLTALGLAGFEWPDLAALTRLSQLKQLALLYRGGFAQHVEHAPEPGSFPTGLQRFWYEIVPGDDVTFQIGGCELKRCMLWHGAACSIACRGLSTPQWPLPTLELHCTSPVPSLARLLSALQPAGAAPHVFQRLELKHRLPQPHQLATCTQLSQLRELSITDPLPAAGSSLADALAGMLQQATRLSSLHISTDDSWGRFAMLGTVPACLASYRGLTSLALSRQGLTELPDGDYLADLEELDLSSNEFTCLPPALSAAIALTRLSISGNTELALCQADAALLLALPHLKFLEIARCCPAAPALLEELEQRMPQLFICMW